MRIASCLWLALALLILGSTAAWPQAPDQAPPVDENPAEAGPIIDPPGRVARLSFIRGEVTFQAADGEAPVEAVINRPITSGDRLITGADSRAELTMGIAAIRLNSNTDLSIAILDAEIAELEVNSGSVSVHVRDLPAGETFQLNTPGSTIRLLERGHYRVDVAADGSATLGVRSGDAEIDSGQGPVRVGARQLARLDRNARYADIRAINRMDAFDEWSADRERQMVNGEAERYVSREVVGYEDLDRYGTWRSEPDYGMVWYPTTVMAGWAPYRYGSWTWISPWGWTWIDHAPWGFAPFHYGRWAFVRHRWCWVPGPRFRRPVYAPGLVVWASWHDHHGFHAGKFHHRHRYPKEWFPLGPREVYVPHHRASPRYLRNVNVSNTHIANNTLITHAARNRLRDIRFANREVPGALSSAPRMDAERRTRWQTDNPRPPAFAASRGRSDHLRTQDDRRLHSWRDRDDNDRRERNWQDSRRHERRDHSVRDPTWRGPDHRDPTWQTHTWRGDSRNDRVGSPKWSGRGTGMLAPEWQSKKIRERAHAERGARHHEWRSQGHRSERPPTGHSRPSSSRSDGAGVRHSQSHQSRPMSSGRSQGSHSSHRGSSSRMRR